MLQAVHYRPVRRQRTRSSGRRHDVQLLPGFHSPIEAMLGTNHSRCLGLAAMLLKNLQPWQRVRKPLTVLLLVTPLGLTAGCAGGLASLSGKKTLLGCGDCADGCESSCLPQDASVSLPAASINHTQRCVDPLPKDAVAAPVGTYVHDWRAKMSDSAQQSHWLITRNEWFDGGSQLGPLGQKHVDRIASCW